MRFLQHLKLLQRLARRKIRRVYCGKTFNHYYFNTVYGTTSWKKPYCLRGAELFPYLTPDEAAARMQGMYRAWIARQRAIRRIFSQYNKLFYRDHGVFYYAFIGPSNLIPRQSYRKPRLLGRRGYPKDLKPVLTEDVYAIRIQRKWRSILVWKFLRTIVRKCIRRDWDPILGKFVYVNIENNFSSFDKPKLLRHEAWDPNYVPDWNIERITIFMRRLGLRQYVELVNKYAIDGRTLLLLEESDFLLMGVTTTIHAKKIMLALEDVYPTRFRDKIGAAYLLRLEKIRRHGAFEEASLVVQRVYRGHLGRKFVAYLRETRRLAQSAKERNDKVEASKDWYTDQLKKADKTGAKFQKRVKDFGRFSEHLTVHGWGHYGVKGWAPVAVVEDGNPTRAFTERLVSSGYDERRELHFTEQRKIEENRRLVVHDAPHAQE